VTSMVTIAQCTEDNVEGNRDVRVVFVDAAGVTFLNMSLESEKESRRVLLEKLG